MNKAYIRHPIIAREGLLREAIAIGQAFVVEGEIYGSQINLDLDANHLEVTAAIWWLQENTILFMKKASPDCEIVLVDELWPYRKPLSFLPEPHPIKGERVSS